MKSVVVIMITTLLLTGCWDHQDLPDILYSTALGVDYKNGQYEVYAQFATFSVIAHSEDVANVDHEYAIGKGKGKTINMAVNDLYGSSQRRIYLSHIRSVILTENVLLKTKGEYIDGFQRYREFRFTPWIFGTKDDIYTLLKTSNFFDLSPLITLMNEPTSTYKQKSLIHPINLQEYMLQVNEPGNTVILPSLALDKVTWKSEYKPEYKLNYNGAFTIEKMTNVKFLPIGNTNGFRWMNSGTKRTPLELTDAVVAMQDIKTSITYQENKQIFEIKVKANGNIVGLIQNAAIQSEEKLLLEAQEKIKSEIEQTYNEGLKKGVDVYSLKHQLYLSNEHRKAMGKFILNKNSINIKVKVKIIHSGQIDFDTTH